MGNWFQKPAKTNRVSVGPCQQHTECFALAHPHLGQKTSLVNFKHKITTSTNYTDGIGTGYTRTSHDKEICLLGKRLKNNFKIIKSN